jgi:hypothetical protein
MGMFIQVIQGKTKDKAGLARRNDLWEAELAPGAKGYLGMTGGVADDGTVILLARFDSEASATANSNRAEQGSWWSETAKYFDGDVTFRNCADVDIEQIGDLDSAGFVQIMQGTSSDKARVRKLGPQLTSKMAELRPDVLGTVIAWDADQFTQVVYFRSEAEARQGEQKMGDAPRELQEVMELAPAASYVDLKEPWIKSA